MVLHAGEEGPLGLGEGVGPLGHSGSRRAQVLSVPWRFYTLTWTYGHYLACFKEVAPDLVIMAITPTALEGPQFLPGPQSWQT